MSLTDFAFMQGIWSQANQLLWQVTEGQTYIAQVNMVDNVQPFSYASELGNTYNPTNLDVVVYTTGFWDMFGASAFVTYDPTYGRDGRLMALQTTNNANTILHEAFHFLYVLSWRYYQLTNIHACLDDEYNFSPDDAECVMEINFTPTIRLCSGGTLPNGNHLVDAVNSTTGTAQAWQISGPPPVGAPFVYEDGQPRSCWEQLIADYPGMVYGGQNSTTQTTPATQFSINNTGTQ